MRSRPACLRFILAFLFKKSTNLVRFGMPVVRYMTSLIESTPEFLFGQVATLFEWYHVVDGLSSKNCTSQLFALLALTHI